MPNPGEGRSSNVCTRDREQESIPSKETRDEIHPKLDVGRRTHRRR